MKKESFGERIPQYLVQTTMNENLNIDNYALKMKGFVETLESWGHYISDIKLINHILNGLGHEYDLVVASLIIRIKSKCRKSQFT